MRNADKTAGVGPRDHRAGCRCKDCAEGWSRDIRVFEWLSSIEIPDDEMPIRKPIWRTVADRICRTARQKSWT